MGINVLCQIGFHKWKWINLFKHKRVCSYCGLIEQDIPDDQWITN